MLKPIVKRSDFVRPREASQLVSGQDAFVDRIALTIGDWGLFGPRDVVLGQLNELRHSEIVDVNGEMIPLFKPFMITSLFRKLNVYFATSPEQEVLTRSAPLISGRVEKSAQFRRPEQLKDANLQICFAANLNLTRWVQAQPLKRVTRVNRPALEFGPVMAIAPEAQWYESEMPLVPDTNVIVGDIRRYGYAKCHSIETHLENYLQTVLRLLETTMEDLPFDGQVRPARAPFLSLREIEFYWEFDEADPVKFVADTQQTVASLGPIAFFGSRSVNVAVEFQSPSVAVCLKKGVWLKVYAKTDRRVRFEVLLKNSAIERIIGARSGTSVQSIVSMVGPLREAATQHMNDVLPLIDRMKVARGYHTPVLLVSEIQRNLAETQTAQVILSALVSFGRIAPFKNDPLRLAVHRLRDAGILETVKPRSRCYTVTEDYRSALNSLQRSLSFHGEHAQRLPPIGGNPKSTTEI